MERPERYDPEDLEHLMLERSFDELLEEERAYALRHLEGRAEYERMRDLLLRVQDERQGQAPIDADPAIRERVLDAFRAQHRPRWEIWLNSVQAFLLPRRSADLWRPALAFASFAIVITTSVLLWRSAERKEHPVLAEVQPVVQKEATPPAPTVIGNASPPPEESPAVPIQSELTETQQAPQSATGIVEAKDENTSERKSVSGSLAATGTSSSYYAQSADAPVHVAETEMDLRDDKAKVMAPVAAVAKGYTSNNVVASADSTGIRKKAGSLAQSEEALLGLLRAAW